MDKKGGEATFSKVCIVSLSIGQHYKDQIICDILEMDACHILLGRPWQHDTDYVHRGRANTIELDWMSRGVVLLPICSSLETKLFTVLKGKDFLPSNTTPLLAFVIKGTNITSIETHLPIEITHLLAEFPKITKSTTSLSPLRNIQHTIDLMPDSTLTNLPH